MKARSRSRNHRPAAAGRGFAGVQTRIDLYTGQLTNAGHLAARENPDTIAAALKWADYWWRHDRYVRALVDLKVRFALYGLKITGKKQADDPAEVLRRNQFVRSVWRDRWVFDNCIAFWLDDGEGALTLDPLMCEYKDTFGKEVLKYRPNWAEDEVPPSLRDRWRAKAIQNDFEGKVGAIETVTNFDHKIIYVYPEASLFDSRRWDTITARMMHWAGSLSPSVRLKGNSGLVASADGLSVDFGPGTNQVARGDHTHGAFQVVDQAQGKPDADGALVRHVPIPPALEFECPADGRQAHEGQPRGHRHAEERLDGWAAATHNSMGCWPLPPPSDRRPTHQPTDALQPWHSGARSRRRQHASGSGRGLVLLEAQQRLGFAAHDGPCDGDAGHAAGVGDVVHHVEHELFQ